MNPATKSALAVFALAMLLAPAALPAESGPVVVPVSRDTWVSAVGAEREGNNGASPRLKLKGIQEFSLVDGDFSALKGRRIPTGRAPLAPWRLTERLWTGNGLDDLRALGGRHGDKLRQIAGGRVFPVAGRFARHHGGDPRQRRFDLEIRRRIGPRPGRMAVDPHRPGGDPGTD